METANKKRDSRWIFSFFGQGEHAKNFMKICDRGRPTLLVGIKITKITLGHTVQNSA